jgi:hypothetical protein
MIRTLIDTRGDEDCLNQGDRRIPGEMFRGADCATVKVRFDQDRA